ncbi:MAG: hypothetical protein OXF02_03730 [Simkaniaceae bacterium]|nr:hypothetical protein [Simkaniaceae bacterium]
MLPIGDYEVVETREVCPVLKKPKIEKSVKVGGGKQPRGDKGDPSDTGGGKQSADKEETERGESGVADGKSRRNRGRGNQRGGEMKKGRQVGGRTVEGGSRSPKEQGENFVREGSIAQERKKVVKRRPVLPPPSGLISEQISRYKEYVPGGGDADGKVGGSRQEFEADEGDLSENGGEAPREE